jgi:type VI secretion system protein ImpJ
MGRKNFRLCLDSELDDELVTLPLARIRRDGAGRFVYDRRFVPPLLQVSASDHVMTILHDLCELLDRKNRTVKYRAKGSEHLPNYNRGDLRDFWFLHTINSSLPALRHQLLSKKSHPEELYRELARLAGALSCFSIDGNPRDLPLFSHDDFGACMELLVKNIHDWLELIDRTNLISLPLMPKSPAIFSASINDQRCFDPSRWILGIRSKTTQGNVATKAPQLVKVCSEKFVEELVRRALPGMTLTHLPVPPARLDTVETEYFGIAKEGRCWDHIIHTKHIGVYVPDDLPDPKLELHVLLGE